MFLRSARFTDFEGVRTEKAGSTGEQTQADRGRVFTPATRTKPGSVLRCDEHCAAVRRRRALGTLIVTTAGQMSGFPYFCFISLSALGVHKFGQTGALLRELRES